MYFLLFFHMDIADQIALFKGLLPPPEGGGKLVFGDNMLNPIQDRIHRLLGQPDEVGQIFSSG